MKLVFGVFEILLEGFGKIFPLLAASLASKSGVFLKLKKTRAQLPPEKDKYDTSDKDTSDPNCPKRSQVIKVQKQLLSL